MDNRKCIASLVSPDEPFDRPYLEWEVEGSETEVDVRLFATNDELFEWVKNNGTHVQEFRIGDKPLERADKESEAKFWKSQDEKLERQNAIVRENLKGAIADLDRWYMKERWKMILLWLLTLVLLATIYY